MENDRQFIRMDPGMWIAWQLDGGWFHGQIHRSWFEVPKMGRLLGVFIEEPSEEVMAEMREVLEV